ncbi:MAG TPA: D-aminoacylase [Mycobacteriales bacterium]|nr:D-aminoacylase [Mycobacteriales bacterium]
MPATLVLRGGTVVDGTGAPARRADVAVDGDRIVAVGELDADVDAQVLDATGQVVAPGFVNVLSHAWGTLQVDPSGASDLLQGVTTEVFGEAFSLGPGEVSKALRNWDGLGGGAQVDFDRLSEGLDHLERRGVAPNVASFIGGVNLRVLGAGFDDRPLTTDELDRLGALVDEEMAEGALGIGTALIYAPGRFARTEELLALCKVIGRHGGTYISHLRSEGDQFLECLDELLMLGRDGGCRAEVYHLKAAGRHNWHKMKLAIERIEQARESGQAVSANMYPYTAGGTALAASIPPRFHVGGPDALNERLTDPQQRREMAAEMRARSDDFENLFLGAGGDGILFLDDLADGTPANGRTLADLAADFGLDDADALLEIVARDPGTGAAYFLMDEDNVRLGLQQPWVSVGSDAGAHRAAPPFTDSATHPRTYGTFARVLGHYGRDEGLFPLEEGVRRMTSLPADNFGLVDRGRVVEGGFADLVVLDPDTYVDHATFADPHRYASGVRHVVVNGRVAVADGELTKETPGRRLRRGK